MLPHIKDQGEVIIQPEDKIKCDEWMYELERTASSKKLRSSLRSPRIPVSRESSIRSTSQDIGTVTIDSNSVGNMLPPPAKVFLASSSQTPPPEEVIISSQHSSIKQITSLEDKPSPNKKYVILAASLCASSFIVVGVVMVILYGDIS